MKLFRIPHFIAFLICLVFGRTAGGYIARAEMSTERIFNSQTLQIEQLPHINNQYNVLVIQVDDLNNKAPSLEVIWWLLHKKGIPLNLIPLYPSLEALSQDQRIAQSYNLVRDRESVRLDPKFEAALHDQGIHWDGYIILDDWALSRLTNSADLNLTKNSSSPSTGLESEDEHLRIRSLTQQWQDVCKNTLEINWLDTAQKELLQELLQSHIILGPDVPFTKTAWKQILSQNLALRCVFPASDPQLDQ